MNEDEVEDKQSTSAQVSHQEVWGIFENIWLHVYQTRLVWKNSEIKYAWKYYVNITVVTGQEQSKCFHKNNSWQDIKTTLFFFSIPLTPRIIFFCHISAWRCSKHWALTLAPCRLFLWREAWHFHRKLWPVCTNWPLWSCSCSKPSAGTTTHTFCCHFIPV